MQAKAIAMPIAVLMILIGISLWFFSHINLGFQMLFVGFIIAWTGAIFLIIFKRSGWDDKSIVIVCAVLGLLSVSLTLFVAQNTGLLWWVIDGLSGPRGFIPIVWILIYGIIAVLVSYPSQKKENKNLKHEKLPQKTMLLKAVIEIPLATITGTFGAFVLWSNFLSSFQSLSLMFVLVFGGELILSFLAGLACIIGLEKILFELAIRISKNPSAPHQEPKEIPTQNLVAPQKPKFKLPKPSLSSIIFLILGIATFSLAIYGLVLLQEKVRYFVESLMTGDLQLITDAFTSISATTGYLIEGIAVIAVIFIALIFYGVYVDLAKRSGFPVTSRIKLLISPIIYLSVIIAAFVPIFLLVAKPLLALKLSDFIIWIIPAALIAFGLLVLVGSLPLWALHRKETTLIKSILFSVRLMLSPLIDAFWSAAASFVGVAIALPILQISAMISLVSALGEFRAGLNLNNLIDSIWQSFGNLFNYSLSDNALLTYLIPFMVVGILMSIYIYKRGPSGALERFYSLMAFVMPISIIAVTYVLSTYLGDWGFLFWALIIIPLIIVCVVYFFSHLIIGFIIGGFRISGTFGLIISIFSALLLVLFFGAIPNIPLVGGIIMDLIKNNIPWVLTVAAEVGVIGIVAGIIIIILAFKEKEEKQVFSQAIAISVGASTVLPFIFVLVLKLPGLLGGLVGGVLVFALISPIYLLAVTLLRLRLAIKTFINPRQDYQKSTETSPEIDVAQNQISSSLSTTKELTANNENESGKSTCYTCGQQTDSKMVCKQCGKIFCYMHIKPKNHACLESEKEHKMYWSSHRQK